MLQIGITPTVPHDDAAGTRGRIVGATAIRIDLRTFNLVASRYTGPHKFPKRFYETQNKKEIFFLWKEGTWEF